MKKADKRAPTVLVVENHRDVLELVTTIVSAHGWRALAAASLQEARSSLKKNPVDAIVTDLELDDGDGLTLVKEVKKTLPPDMPILIISSYASPEIRRTVRQAGAVELLAKPFRLEQLAKALGHALGPQELMTASRLQQ